MQKSRSIDHAPESDSLRLGGNVVARGRFNAWLLGSSIEEAIR
jgi:hypothetical protein